MDEEARGRSHMEKSMCQNGTRSVRRGLLVVMLLLLALCVLPTRQARAADRVAGGTFPDAGVTWELDSDGLLSIEGTGSLSLSKDKWQAGLSNYCTQVKHVSIASTVSLSDLSWGFRGWSSLESVDTTGWNIPAGSSVESLFAECSALETANVTGLVTSDKTTVSNMFESCTALSTISGLTSWDTSKVTDMSMLFFSCKALESLDLSSFDCTSVTDNGGMLSSCTGLKTFVLGSRFVFRPPSGQYFEIGLEGTWRSSSTGKDYEDEEFVDGLDGSTIAGTYRRVDIYSAQVTIDNVAGSVAYRRDTDKENFYYGHFNGSKLGPRSESYSLVDGASYTIEFWPGAGYEVKSVIVDGADQGRIQEYSLADVSSNHTLEVTFEKRENIKSVLVSCECGVGGSIAGGDEGTTSNSPGTWSENFAFEPDFGYVIDDVKLDGVSQGPVSTLYLDKISADHDITVTFREAAAGRHVIRDADISSTTRYAWGNPSSLVVTDDSSATIYFTHSYQHSIVDVEIDGVSQGPIDHYTFEDVTADHTFRVVSTTTDVKRLYGENALDTMASIVYTGFSPTSGTVVLCTSQGYWDALTAAGAAGFSGAPVVLTEPGSLSKQARNVLSYLAPRTLIVCGGTAAVSDEVASEAKAAAGGASVKRLAGTNAIGTADQVLVATPDAAWSGTAIIATSDGYWDALAAAPYAYHAHCPIVLADGHTSLKASTLEAMRTAGITRAIIVGGTEAVSTNVESQLAEAGITLDRRLAGDNAISTSSAIAEFEISQGMSADGMAVATSNGYWDALTGAALCGSRGSVLVLASDSNHSAIDTVAGRYASAVSVAYVFGGPAAVSEGTLDYFARRLG